MSAYATAAQLTSLGLPAKALSAIPAGDVTAALESASRKADSYIQSRYKLPLTTWTSDLTEAVCALAAYSLMTTRGFNAGSTDSESLRLRAKDADSWLINIAKGLAQPAFGTIDSAAPVAITNAPFVLAPASGSTGTSSGSFYSKDSDVSVAVGTPGPPRPRGW